MLWYPVQRQRLPSSPCADRGLVRRLAALDEAHRREDHAGRAVAALERVVVVEGLLNRMELAVRRKSFDRRDLHPVGLDSEHRARLHRLAVHEHGARPARGRVAAHVRPGEPESLAEHVHEKLTRLDLEVVAYAVRGQRHSSHRLSLPRRQPRERTTLRRRWSGRWPCGHAQRRRFSARSISRWASRSATTRRLSARSRPRASAISTFTRPSLKYMRVGTSVSPFSRTFPYSESISPRWRRSLRSRSDWWPSGPPCAYSEIEAPIEPRLAVRGCPRRPGRAGPGRHAPTSPRCR